MVKPVFASVSTNNLITVFTLHAACHFFQYFSVI